MAELVIIYILIGVVIGMWLSENKVLRVLIALFWPLSLLIVVASVIVRKGDWLFVAALVLAVVITLWALSQGVR